MSYFEHTAAPYPLADEYGDVPTNILSDMSLTVDETYKDTAVITALRVTTHFAFVAIETATGPLAYVHVVSPVPGRIYRFENDGPGWVVFGGGARTPYDLAEGETLALDPKCLIIESPDIQEFSLRVNDVVYEMPDVLNVAADGFLQLQVTERRVYLNDYNPEESSSSSSSSSGGSSASSNSSSSADSDSSGSSSSSSDSSNSSSSSGGSSDSSSSSSSSTSSSSDSSNSSNSSSSSISDSSSSSSSSSSSWEYVVNEKSVEFDGSDDYIALDSELSLDKDGSTVSLWFKAPTTANQNTFLGHTSNGDNINLNTDNQISVEAGVYVTAWAFAADIADGQWHLLVFRRNSSSDNRMYVDNVESISGARLIPAAVELDRIGRRGTSYEWEGNLDEIGVWNKALSYLERTELYGDGCPENLRDHSAVANLTNWWRMGDDDTFPTIRDVVGGNHGTMTNMIAGDIVSDVPPCPLSSSSASSESSSSSNSSSSNSSSSSGSSLSSGGSSDSSSSGGSSDSSSSSSLSSGGSSDSSSSSNSSSQSQSSQSQSSNSSESSGSSSSSQSSSSDSSDSSNSSSSLSSTSSSSSVSDSSFSSEIFPPVGPSEVVTVIEIRRNDDAIDPSILNGGMTSVPFPPVKVIGGASPDDFGNIDIIVELEPGLLGSGGVYIVECANPEVSGYILWTSGIPGCGGEQDLLELLKRSDFGVGVPYELPFDALLGALKCEQPPCGPVPPVCDEE